MNKILAIAQKELKTYFYSPMAYIILVLTTSVFNIFFFMIVDQSQEATLRDIFKLMEFIFIFIIPLLTMKVFAEERSTGTMEFLLTTPTLNSTIVFGKYLGVLIFYSLMIFLSGIYFVALEIFAQPERLVLLSGYFGVWLEGAFFIAVGVMASSWTKNQVIAALTSYVMLLILYFTVVYVKYASGWVQSFLKYLGAWSHSENLAAGVIHSGDLIYFISGIIFCLMMTRLSLQQK